MPYVHRLVDPLLDELLLEASAVLVTGPRACGKTTTASQRAQTIIKLDAAAQAAAFIADPDAALSGLGEPVLLDEWQAVPGVLGAARRAVDADPRPDRFYLAGSVRSEVGRELWPGTGRLLRLPMYPMTEREVLGRAAGKSFFDRVADGDGLASPSEAPNLRGYLDLAARGGFPRAAFAQSPRVRRMWLRSYLDDLLTHDAEEVEPSRTRPRDPGRLRSYLEAYALNSSGTPEHRTIYTAAGVSKDTAAGYESLLSRLLIVEQTPAWTTNRLKRLINAPKRYLIDPALMLAALRLDVGGVMSDGDMLGRIIESFVVAQLRPEVVIADCEPRLHHLRTQGGRHEIDLLAELGGGRVIAMEIKATSSPRSADARHLRWLRDELGTRFVAGLVFHTGPRVFEIDDRIWAAPIASIWT